jgi:hypothetical protein
MPGEVYERSKAVDDARDGERTLALASRESSC